MGRHGRRAAGARAARNAPPGRRGRRPPRRRDPRGGRAHPCRCPVRAAGARRHRDGRGGIAPALPHPVARGLADLRRTELRTAIAALAPDAEVRCLDLPDGEVAAHVETVVAALVETIGTAGDDVVLCAPWRGDGHPDHEAVGRAAAIAAVRTDALLLEYPVWLWHWSPAGPLPADASRFPLEPADLAAKRSAVAAHASQVSALSAAPGDEVLLGPDLLAHFDRPDEVFLHPAGAAPDEVLDQLHRDEPDPWEVDSPYERRKRAVTLASLPHEHYGDALELGCSVGALAVDLAGRCDRLLAVDASPAAIDLARGRTSGVPHVDLLVARVPLQWPEGRRDLISISEIGYFLSPRELDDVVTRAFASLTDDGHLLLCHWRHQPVGWPLAGPAVHDAFLATGAPVLVEHQEPDFLLHVLGRPS